MDMNWRKIADYLIREDYRLYALFCWNIVYIYYYYYYAIVDVVRY